MKHNFFYGMLSIFLISLPVMAAKTPVTPEQSLDDDLAGSAVGWFGQIAEIIPTVEDTCFVFNRVQPLQGSYALTATKFISCAPGRFQDEAFSLGKIIRVDGNLGADMSRRIGSREIEAPLIAAPKLVSQPDMPAYAGPPPYRYYRYGDPFWDPWYPHFGVGIGYRRWH